MRYGRQFFFHTLFSLSAAVLTGLMFYGLRIFLFRTLSTEEYASFYTAMSLASLLGPFLTFGFDPGVVPFITAFREEKDWFNMRSTVISVLIPQAFYAVVIVSVFELFPGFLSKLIFGSEDNVLLLRIIALYIGSYVFYRAGFSVLLGLQMIGTRAVVELFYSFCCLAGSCIFVRAGAGGVAPALAYIAALWTGTLLVLVSLLIRCPMAVRGAFQVDFLQVKKIFHLGKYVSFTYAGMTAFANLDTLMLVMLGRDYTAVAAYQVAIPTLMIPFSFILAGAYNFLPLTTTLWKRGEQERLVDGLCHIFDTAVLLITPMMTILACYADIVIPMLFKRDVLNAPRAFSILAFGSIPFFLCFFSIQVLVGIKKAVPASTAVAVALGVNIVMNATLIPLMGLYGAAAATVLSYATGAFLLLRALQKKLQFHYRLTTWPPVILTCLLIVVAVRWLRTWPAFHAHPQWGAFLSSGLLFILSVSILEAIGVGRLRELVRIIGRVSG